MGASSSALARAISLPVRRRRKTGLPCHRTVDGAALGDRGEIDLEDGASKEGLGETEDAGCGDGAGGQREEIPPDGEAEPAGAPVSGAYMGPDPVVEAPVGMEGGTSTK